MATENTIAKLAYIEETKLAIKQAIIDKGVSLQPSDTFRSYAIKIGEIETGGGGPGEGDYLVTFIDYDGTILKEQRVNSGQTATAPDVPTHDNLSFQAWNNTFTNVTADINIGATYITTDGKSYLYIRVSATTGLSPVLYLKKSNTALMTVTWGDGNLSTSSSSNTITLSNTYAAEGDYIITVTCSGGYLFGHDISDVPIFEDGIYSDILKAIRIGANVTTIAIYSFKYNHALATITIPLSVTSIKSRAFDYCYSLISVTMPSNVPSILLYTFNNCYSLKSVTIPLSVTIIESSAFNNCYALSFLTIPPNVTSIGNTVFTFCYSLKSVTIPASVTSIGDQIFSNCYSLASITILSSITLILLSSFSNCYPLRSITIPASVTSISSYAFYRCYSLIDYVIQSTIPPTLANINALQDITKIAKIYVPDDSVNAYKVATNWITYANYIYPISTRL